ncbi:NAD(P)H-dependent oxidoreductase [Rodentibacter myodis]|uniref:Flavodoxin n=1 Tax=Rodentibacter myodis TaxID=1907939 RepID=A0A1V3JG78_9PAST|nr:NAD(P)H-dependent oxidoreductase [Rodentibacter myodis]OOF55623.1 flavodoxin [Rodentibacter myodis]
MNILILNGHQPYEFSPGKLTASLIEKATALLEAKGHQVRHSNVLEYNIEEEFAKYQWADAVIFQFPVHWMSVPWMTKKYIDDVFIAGGAGVFCNNDGRSSKNPTANYGTGGLMGEKKYLLSATFNAPKQAFDDPNEYLFQGKSLEDLLLPLHSTFRFFAMQTLPSFACYDVLKNPQIEQDFARWEAHLNAHF